MAKTHYDHMVVICNGSDCKKAGAKALRKTAKSKLRELGLNKQSIIVKTKCTGNCKRAPVACVQPLNRWLFKVDEEDLIAAIERQAEELGG